MPSWSALDLAVDFGLPLLLGVLGLWLIRTAFPRKAKGKTPICRACAYDLTAITSDRCPECGFPIHAPIRDVLKLIRKKRIAAGLILAIPMLWVLWMCITFYSWALPLRHSLSQLNQPRSSGVTVIAVWPRSIREPWDPNRLSPRQWLAAKAAGGPAAAEYLTQPGNVTLSPRPIPLFVAPAAPLSPQIFFLHWLLWPDAHYRRYLDLPSGPFEDIFISNATPDDREVFTLLAAVGPITDLNISHSRIDGETLEAISRLTSLTFLRIHAVTAPLPELLRLRALVNLETLFIDFGAGRPVGPHDIQILFALPNLQHLELTAHQVQPGCDAALAQLVARPALWRIKLNIDLSEEEFPLTLAAMRKRFQLPAK